MCNKNKCCCCDCDCEPTYCGIEAKIRRGIKCSGEDVDINKIDRNMNCTLNGQQRWNVYLSQTFVDAKVISSIECASGLTFEYIETNGRGNNLHLIFDNRC